MIYLNSFKWNSICKVNNEENKNEKLKVVNEIYSDLKNWKYEYLQNNINVDYAITKKHKLENLMGFKPYDLKLATCWIDDIKTGKTGGGEYHAVLCILTNEGDYILDNRADDPILFDRFPYKWDKILVTTTMWKPFKEIVF